MADEKKPDSPKPVKAPGFLRRNLSLVLFAVGVILGPLGVLYWTGPARRAQRVRFDDDLEQVHLYLRQQRWREAREALASLEERSWRRPERRAEVLRLRMRVECASAALMDRADATRPLEVAAAYAESALRSETRPGERRELTRTLGRLQVALSRYVSAIPALRESAEQDRLDIIQRAGALAAELSAAAATAPERLAGDRLVTDALLALTLLPETVAEQRDQLLAALRRHDIEAISAALTDLRPSAEPSDDDWRVENLLVPRPDAIPAGERASAEAPATTKVEAKPAASEKVAAKSAEQPPKPTSDEVARTAVTAEDKPGRGDADGVAPESSLVAARVRLERSLTRLAATLADLAQASKSVGGPAEDDVAPMLAEATALPLPDQAEHEQLLCTLAEWLIEQRRPTEAIGVLASDGGRLGSGRRAYLRGRARFEEAQRLERDTQENRSDARINPPNASPSGGGRRSGRRRANAAVTADQSLDDDSALEAVSAQEPASSVPTAPSNSSTPTTPAAASSSPTTPPASKAAATGDSSAADARPTSTPDAGAAVSGGVRSAATPGLVVPVTDNTWLGRGLSELQRRWAGEASAERKLTWIRESAILDLRTALADRSLQRDGTAAAALLMLGRCHAAIAELPQARQRFEELLSSANPDEVTEPARFLFAGVVTRQAIEATARFPLERLPPEATGRLEFALESWSSALERATRPKAWRNRFLPTDELRRECQEAWRRLQAAGHFDVAARFAQRVAPYQQAGQADRWVAESNAEEARWFEGRAERAGPDPDPALLAEARVRWRRSGVAWRKVAEINAGELEYPALLRRAADAMFNGQDFEAAIADYRRFRGADTGEQTLAVMVREAEALMSLNRHRDALSRLDEGLLEWPRSPDRFAARLKAVNCCLELARQIDPPAEPAAAPDPRIELFKRAETLLGLNLDGLNRDLDPGAREWRDSLFLHGRFLHEQGRDDEAIVRLREALRRFPTDRRRHDSLLRIAEGLTRGAEPLEKEIEAETVERRRAQLADRRIRRLSEARDTLRGLIDELSEAQRSAPLASGSVVILRSACFRLGDVLMSLEAWVPAIEAWTVAANRFQDRAEVLIAYVRISDAYVRLGRPDDARSTLRQAEWVLDQLADGAFDPRGPNRDQWKRRLSELADKL
jgi:tetratricopeptide (TPR) repeat protein